MTIFPTCGEMPCFPFAFCVKLTHREIETKVSKDVNKVHGSELGNSEAKLHPCFASSALCHFTLILNSPFNESQCELGRFLSLAQRLQCNMHALV